ncbi:MAG: DAK2 domain-containing protein [Bacilli bacterium]|nr:DAK2 domain-containing protein [Bacilli bacterium]
MKTINASTLKQMLISGANNLYNHYPEVDRLNVFPVPDGDTGMNMNLTFTSGTKEIQNRNDENVYDLSKAFSMGLLMGARGNSGVITSQIFRGFAEGLKNIKNPKFITIQEFINALVNGKEVAYKAVQKPVEGTILTVIRETATVLSDKAKDISSIENLMKEVVLEAEKSLAHTPELLPVLKEVGVVDSGGTGLWRIFEGMERAINDDVVERVENVETSGQSPEMPFLSQADVPLYAGAQLSEDEEGYGYCTQFIIRLGEEGSGKKPFDEKKFQKFLATHGKMVERIENVETSGSEVPTLEQQEVALYAVAQLSEDEEGYGYCTQFILRIGKPEDGKKPFDEKKFRRFLATHGKSLVLVRDDDIVKVHVHTLTPGNMLNYAQNYGEFVTITIENMSEEHRNIEQGRVATDMEGSLQAERAQKKEKTKYGLIAVSSGEGLDEMFHELGVEQIVSGGQTMNPSTQDFLSAIDKLNAENVFILPNNSNIVMAASQACSVLEGKINARVIPSKTIPQGIASLMQFSPESEPDDVYQDMRGALKNVRSGSVTYAIKDTDIEGVHITKDYYMAMEDKKIVSCVKDREESLFDLLDSMIDDNAVAVSIYVGKDVDEPTIEKVSAKLNEKYGNMVDVLVHKGGQPVYSYLVGIE